MGRFGFQLFLSTQMQTECEQCGVRFDLVKGGACVKCRRALCPTHLHGSFARRLLVDLGAQPICLQCRRGVTAPQVKRDR